MKILTNILLILACWALFSCEEKNVVLDNSGEESLQVSVNSITFTLPGKTYHRMTLEPGLHSLVIRDEEGKTLEESKFQLKEAGLINAAKGEYLIWTEWFGDQSKKETTLKQEWVKFGDLEIFGEFDQIAAEEVFVEQRWDFSIDEELPESVRGWELGEKRWVVKKKLFRLEDALKYYQAVSEN